MTFQDIFKSSFLKGFASTQMTTYSMFVCFASTVLFGAYIFLVYRLFTRKTFYNKSFAISVAAIAVITAAIILSIQSSIVISLGMVGALSIVRFRTAIKDPMDLVFLFWSISVGIICGAGFAAIALYSSLTITLVLFVLQRVPIAKAPKILVVNADSAGIEGKLMDTVKRYSGSCSVKSRNISPGKFDVVVEVRTKNEVELVKSVSEQEGVLSASLISHDGEVTF